MDFSVNEKRVMANLLIKFNKGDPKFENAYGLQQVMKFVADKEHVHKRNVRITFGNPGLVKVEERLIEWNSDASENWTDTAACEINSYNLADILINPLLNSQPCQAIQTEVLNLQFELNRHYHYISKKHLKFHLAKRKASLIWSERFGPIPKKFKFVKPAKVQGNVYGYFVDVGDEYIYVYIGKHAADVPRKHELDEPSSLSYLLLDHPNAKYFVTSLFLLTRMIWPSLKISL